MTDLRKGEHGLSIAERIEKYTDQTGTPKGCKMWLASVTKFGYPALGVYKNQGSGLVHLQLAKLHNIVKPHGHYVMTRTCKNKLCVNYLHLQWRTKSDVCREASWAKYDIPAKLKKKAKAKKAPTRYLCHTCGITISAWFTKRKYCSTECLKASHVGKLKKCIVCKKKFNAPIGKPGRIICSDKCRLENLQVHAIKHFAAPSNKVYFRQCEGCDSWFYTRSKTRRRFTCSDKCYKEYHRLKVLVRSLRGQFLERTTPCKKDTDPRENGTGRSSVAQTGSGTLDMHT